MPDDDAAEPSRGRLAPEVVARQTFDVARRGYDQAEVTAFLAKVADALREARDREAALRTEVAAFEAAARPAIELDEDTLIKALGEETARVLTAARRAAVEIREKGEESVGRLLREATDEANRLKTEAEGVLAAKTESAERYAAEIRAEGEIVVGGMLADAEARAMDLKVQAEQARVKANADAEARAKRAEEEAAAVIAQATDQGRSMVKEALAVRERVLKDLNRKRKAARAQLEQLGAGRDRLLEAYDVVRRNLEEATGELHDVLPEAKIAADAARMRVVDEPEPSIADLVAEVERAEAEPEAGAEPEPEAIADAPSIVAEVVEVVDVVAVVEVEVPEIVAVVEVEPEPAPEPEPPAAEEPVVEAEPEEPAGEWPPMPLEPVHLPRKHKGRRDREFQLPETDLVPLPPRDPLEEVRVVHPPTPEPAPAPAAVEEAPAEVEAEPAEETVDVDALFARLRSARQVDVAKAKEVLSDDVAEPVPEAVSEPEPVAEVTPEVHEEATDIDDDVEADDDGREEQGERPADDQALLERRDAITDEVEHRVTRKLKRALADEQNEVLDHLRRTRGADLAAVLPAVEDQVARYAAGAAPELAVAAAGGASFFGGDPNRDTSVDDLASELAMAIVLPLRDRIDASLRDADGDEDTIADLLRSCYREWKTQRLAGEAHHVVLAAFNRALYDATDAGTQLRWLVDDGGSPCPDAEDNALAGLVVRGEPFPTGHCFPPAHPGCRCLLVPAKPEVG